MVKADKRVVNLLRTYAHDERKSFIKGFVLTLIRTGLDLTALLIIGYIINNLIEPGMSQEQILSILKYLSLYLIVNTLAGVILNRTFLSFEKASNNIAYSVQNDVYNKVNTFPISYFDNLPAGKISSRITNDTNKLKNMFRLIFTDIATSLILILGLSLTILITNPIAFLMLLPLSPIIYIIYRSFTNYTRNYTGEIRKNTSEINA